MLKITDTGSTGDLHVTGSGLFGGESIDEDRLLSVQSGREARLEVKSGANYDATVTITAGVDQVRDPSSPKVGFFPVSQYSLEPAFGVWALECGVLTSPRA